jgi:hypothetical protein
MPGLGSPASTSSGLQLELAFDATDPLATGGCCFCQAAQLSKRQLQEQRGLEVFHSDLGRASKQLGDQGVFHVARRRSCSAFLARASSS